MAVGYFAFDVWLNVLLPAADAEKVRFFEFRIFHKEDCPEEEQPEEGFDNLWDVQLVGLSDDVRPVFTTGNDFWTFEADMDWEDPADTVTDCVLKYLCDGLHADVLCASKEGIYVSLPEVSQRREKIY